MRHYNYIELCPVCVQVENLVAIELAYINTKHPDFTEAYTVHRTVTHDFNPGDSHRSVSSSSLARSVIDKQSEDGRVSFSNKCVDAMVVGCVDAIVVGCVDAMVVDCQCLVNKLVKLPQDIQVWSAQHGLHYMCLLALCVETGFTGAERQHIMEADQLDSRSEVRGQL